MRKIILILDAIPSFLFSAIVFLVIPWLTLDPQPIGEIPGVLFPGADKMIHGLMFGGMAVALSTDFQKRNWSKPVSDKLLLFSCLFASVYGVIIEILQGYMDLGRTFELMDIVADIVGAVVCSLIFRIIAHKNLPYVQKG